MDKKELKEREQATLSTVKKVSDHIWMMEFKGDYGLDKLLEKGCKGIMDTARFVQKELREPSVIINPFTRDFGCSTFNTRNADGDVIMGRNFDYKDSWCMVVWTAPHKGYRSISVDLGDFFLYGDPGKANEPKRLLGAPYLCMDGVNEKGLCAAILEIKAKSTKQNTGKKPIINPVAIRAILDKCATVDEAVRLLCSYDMHDMILVNYHYHFADANGSSAIVEYVNNEMKIIRQKEKDENLVLTNYFLSEGGDNRREMGRDRFKNINECLCKCGGVMSEEEAMKLLSENTLYYRHKIFRHMVTTVWSNVYNSQKKTMTLCAGMDYKNMYLFSLDEPGKVIKL